MSTAVVAAMLNCTSRWYVWIVRDRQRQPIHAASRIVVRIQVVHDAMLHYQDYLKYYRKRLANYSDHFFGESPEMCYNSHWPFGFTKVIGIPQNFAIDTLMSFRESMTNTWNIWLAINQINVRFSNETSE
jgi:hypothetical protein